MTRKSLSLAVASAIVGSTLLAPQAAFAQNAEIEALKTQLAALSAKIDQLEKSQTQTKKTVEETQATADKTADVVAQEKSRLSFAGDLRYRYEGFDVQYVEHNREPITPTQGCSKHACQSPRTYKTIGGSAISRSRFG